MQRFLNNGYQEDFIEDAAGEWVRYEDALAREAALQERVKKLEKEFQDMTDAARSYLHACEHDHNLDIAKCTVILKVKLQAYDARSALREDEP